MRAPTIAALIALAVPAVATPPFYVQDIREVCSLPRPTNNGQVLGHDNGSSVLYNGMSYWFFADTFWDLNGSGALEGLGPDKLIGLGTVASTADLDASDGLDMTYRMAGSELTSLFPLSELYSDECLIWPSGSVVANNTIYVFATAVKKTGSVCGTGYENFLASVDPVTLQATRLVMLQDPATTPFNIPFRVSDPDGSGGQINWVYMAGNTCLPPPYYVCGVLLARVREANITTPALYEYWNGSTWVVNTPQAAAVIFWGGIQDTVRITYNDFLGRYLMIYSCNVGLSICGRTANTPGPGSAPLVGGWSQEVVLYDCPGEDFLRCYAGYPHTEYGNGSTLYLTTARINPENRHCNNNSDCTPCDGYPASSCVGGLCTMPPGLKPRYTLRLRQVTIGTSPPPAGRLFYDAGRNYSPKDRCDIAYNGPNPWTFQRLTNGMMFPLTFDQQWNWIGNTDVQGDPAPRMDEDTAFPALAQQAVRVWSAPGAGTVRVTGEVRKRLLCGNTAWAEILRIQNGQPVGQPLWSALLGPTDRSVIYDETISVQAGDSLGFSVRRGGQSAICDDLLFAPVLTYTP